MACMCGDLNEKCCSESQAFEHFTQAFELFVKGLCGIGRLEVECNCGYLGELKHSKDF